MPTATMTRISNRIIIDTAQSTYPSGHVVIPKHELRYSPGLAGAEEQPYYSFRRNLTTGTRPSTAADEAFIQYREQKRGRMPWNSKKFSDIFVRDMYQITDTFLRVPRGDINLDKPDDIVKGVRLYAVEWGIGNKVIGLTFIPEEGVAPYTEDFWDVWDPATGLPRFTASDEKYEKRDSHTAHWSFDSSPELDELSGHYDVAVVRWGDWHLDVGERCLRVGASYRRLDTLSAGGFRPVRGVFEINIKDSTTEQTIKFL